ncbi:hypothetical protein BU17DRAFT_66391 [Hysterangium stoloniferum]|nr:hypothetical protein BU17DRAFT_66391 [Hysterangium stoloniferum]
MAIICIGVDRSGDLKHLINEDITTATLESLATHSNDGDNGKQSSMVFLGGKKLPRYVEAPVAQHASEIYTNDELIASGIAMDHTEKYHKIKGVPKNFGDKLAVEFNLIGNEKSLKVHYRVEHKGKGTLYSRFDRTAGQQIWLLAREIPPWLHKVRWLEFVQDLDVEKVQPMGDLKTAKGEELWILAAIGSYSILDMQER